MKETEPSSTASPPAEAGTASLRRGVRRLGARVREEMQQSLELLFDEAARLAGSDDPVARAAGEAVARAAGEIAARLSRFEEPALEILAAETGGPTAEPAEPESGMAGTKAEEAAPPSQLTRALAGELSQLARHTDTPLDADEADVLRPRIRRAARLANLWLTTSVKVSPASDVPETAGTTSTYGPLPTFASTPSTAREPAPAPAPREGTPVAVVALADRVGRLQHAYGELQERASSRERYWREAIHELRNAAHAFMSWGFVLRRSELKETPWFAPLVRAAEAVLRRAEEALSAERAEDPIFAVRAAVVDLVPLAREGLESIRPAADARNLTLAAAARVRLRASAAGRVDSSPSRASGTRSMTDTRIANMGSSARSAESASSARRSTASAARTRGANQGVSFSSERRSTKPHDMKACAALRSSWIASRQ